MIENLPFSQACENNKGPILKILERVFARCARVLEIGSGTGQHAVFFSAKLPHVLWRPSDRSENLPLIRQWCDACPQANLLAPVTLDINHGHWPEQSFDAVFSANTAHIMAWPTTMKMVQEVAKRLPAGGVFALYGPFNYRGEFTSESNQRFDQHLKQSNPEKGVRDFEAVNQVACEGGLSLIEDNAMPANNRLLVWQKG